jgi:hypothetical protein
MWDPVSRFVGSRVTAGLGQLLRPEVGRPTVNRKTDKLLHRFPYSFTNPFLSFVTVNDPSGRAEILM